MEAELTCGVCLEYFTQPLMLPCGHNFCKGCIEGIIRSKGINVDWRLTLDCPLCLRKSNLDKGINSLPLNRILDNIVACHRGVSNVAYGENSWHTDQELSEPKCIQHNLPMNFYCLNCNFPACRECLCYVRGNSASAEASKHNCIEIKEHAIALQTSIAATLTELKKKVLPLNDRVLLLEDMIKGIGDNEKKIEHQLEMEMTAIKSLLRCRQEELRRVLGNDIREIQRPMQEKLNSYKSLVASIQEHFRKLSMVKGTKSLSLRIKLMQDSLQQLNKLLHRDVTIDAVPTVDMPSWKLNKKALEEAIGSLRWEKKPDIPRQQSAPNFFAPAFNFRGFSSAKSETNKQSPHSKRSGSVGPEFMFGLPSNSRDTTGGTLTRQPNSLTVNDDSQVGLSSSSRDSNNDASIFPQFKGASLATACPTSGITSTSSSLNSGITFPAVTSVSFASKTSQPSAPDKKSSNANIFGHFDNIISTLNNLAVSFSKTSVETTTTNVSKEAATAGSSSTGTSMSEVVIPSTSHPISSTCVTPSSRHEGLEGAVGYSAPTKQSNASSDSGMFTDVQFIAPKSTQHGLKKPLPVQAQRSLDDKEKTQIDFRVSACSKNPISFSTSHTQHSSILNFPAGLAFTSPQNTVTKCVSSAKLSMDQSSKNVVSTTPTNSLTKAPAVFSGFTSQPFTFNEGTKPKTSLQSVGNFYPVQVVTSSTAPPVASVSVSERPIGSQQHIGRTLSGSILSPAVSAPSQDNPPGRIILKAERKLKGGDDCPSLGPLVMEGKGDAHSTLEFSFGAKDSGASSSQPVVSSGFVFSGPASANVVHQTSEKRKSSPWRYKKTKSK